MENQNLQWACDLPNCRNQYIGCEYQWGPIFDYLNVGKRNELPSNITFSEGWTEDQFETKVDEVCIIGIIWYLILKYSKVVFIPQWKNYSIFCHNDWHTVSTNAFFFPPCKSLVVKHPVGVLSTCKVPKTAI